MCTPYYQSRLNLVSEICLVNKLCKHYCHCYILVGIIYWEFQLKYVDIVISNVFNLNKHLIFFLFLYPGVITVSCQCERSETSWISSTQETECMHDYSKPRGAFRIWVTSFLFAKVGMYIPNVSGDTFCYIVSACLQLNS